MTKLLIFFNLLKEYTFYSINIELINEITIITYYFGKYLILNYLYLIDV